MTLEQSLAKLDSALVERFSVPISLVADDYASVAGSDGNINCALNYRLQATSWIAPWGADLPCLLPATSTPVDFGKMTHTLRLPSSRVRHFLCDATLYAKAPRDSEAHITRATLRLGDSKTVQLLDSEFACNVSLVYKKGLNLKNIVLYDDAEKSVTLICPLFFESPLRLLPLFIANTGLPEIEYEVTSNSELKDVQFFTEFITSPDEADMKPLSMTTEEEEKKAKIVIQHIPSLTTFRSSVGTEPLITIPIVFKTVTLGRSFYVRVVRKDCEDVPDAIASIDLVSGTKSLIGMSLPGSICRKHLKTRFGKDGSADLPYYVFTFASNPSSRVPDFAVQLTPTTELKVTLHPEAIQENMMIEVCVETLERIEWNH